MKLNLKNICQTDNVPHNLNTVSIIIFFCVFFWLKFFVSFPDRSRTSQSLTAKTAAAQTVGTWRTLTFPRLRAQTQRLPFKISSPGPSMQFLWRPSPCRWTANTALGPKQILFIFEHARRVSPTAALLPLFLVLTESLIVVALICCSALCAQWSPCVRQLFNQAAGEVVASELS